MLLRLILLFGSLVATSLSAETNSPFEQLAKIEQGKAEFVQFKKLKFLKKPIKSSGTLIINGASLLWHVKTPVESKLLVTGDRIWQYDKSKEQYEKVASQKTVEQIMQTLFAGELSTDLWSITTNTEAGCLTLAAIDANIKKVVNSVEFCLSTNKKRIITLLDTQGNITKIELAFIADKLSEGDLDELKPQK